MAVKNENIWLILMSILAFICVIIAFVGLLAGKPAAFAISLLSFATILLTVGLTVISWWNFSFQRLKVDSNYRISIIGPTLATVISVALFVAG